LLLSARFNDLQSKEELLARTFVQLMCAVDVLRWYASANGGDPLDLARSAEGIERHSVPLDMCYHKVVLTLLQPAGGLEVVDFLLSHGYVGLCGVVKCILSVFGEALDATIGDLPEDVALLPVVIDALSDSLPELIREALHCYAESGDRQPAFAVAVSSVSRARAKYSSDIDHVVRSRESWTGESSGTDGWTFLPSMVNYIGRTISNINWGW